MQKCKAGETRLVYRHELLRRVLLVLVKGNELDILRRTRFIAEGALQGIEIVSADGNELSSPADVLV